MSSPAQPTTPAPAQTTTPAPAHTQAPATKRRGPVRGTLARQIQTRMALTVAALAVLLSGMMLLVAQNLLIRQIDTELDTLPARVQEGGTDLHRPGISRGTLLVVRSGNGVTASIVGSDSVDSLKDGIERLLTLPGGRSTVTLPELGRYRVKVMDTRQGQDVIIGMPMHLVDETMVRLSIAALGITVLAVAVTVLVTRRLIGDATKPLDALTATAEQVSAQRLDRGAVEVPRVDIRTLPPQHEVAKLGQSFNHMLGNVEHALVARETSEQKLRRFVADASHELRNPLASIAGYSQLAERHASGLDDNTAFALHRISAESQRMRKLVEDMMMLARLDAHQQSEPAPVDAVEVVLNATSDARASSPTHQWRLSLPDEPVVVLAGADQLQQVMVNLLGNARKHTPAGTIVEAAVWPDGTITVTDNGPGIAPDVLPHVFERFTRADDARRHSEEHSTGLGLAIVKAQVESFGGTVEVSSVPGRTAFRVRLPLAG